MEIIPKIEEVNANLETKAIKAKVERKGLVLSRTKIKYPSSKWRKTRHGTNSKGNVLNLE
jgi:hypothetical protein